MAFLTLTHVCCGRIAANYHQITRFIQGYVDNEVNLNADKKCSFSCTDFRQTNNFGCHPDTLCAAQHIDPTATRCNGTVYNCEKLDNDLTICPSWQKFQIRRYDFVRSAAGHTLGKNGPCLQTTSVSGAFAAWPVLATQLAITHKPSIFPFQSERINRWPIFRCTRVPLHRLESRGMHIR